MYNEPRLHGACLLVVEDDFLLLKELEAVLREAGAECVETCRTVELALALSGADRITVAILDVRIGRDNVLPVARQLAFCLLYGAGRQRPNNDGMARVQNRVQTGPSSCDRRRRR